MPKTQSPKPVLCNHAVVACINQYELIRKYRCSDCSAVMMCACDEKYGRRFLTHQLAKGTELKTHRRVPVTDGFQGNVCPECRGLPAEPAPLAEGYGSTTKIKRYYWRELFFEETRRKADWDEAHNEASADDRRAAHDAIDSSVLSAIKALHATQPKYEFAEPSQAEILERYKVSIMDLKAQYADAETRKKGKLILDGGAIVSAEQFATKALEGQGWQVIPLESQPFHVLFGVFMWFAIQDPTDPMVRMVGFAEKNEDSPTGGPGHIWALHPSDFGSEGYAQRRKKALDKHFKVIEREDDLLWLFDHWLPYSHELRQYLWAHHTDDIARARRVVELLPHVSIVAILRYLVGAYWDRYLGWPDLLLTREGEFEFAEVKSSNDKLSGSQKNWIADNHDILHFKFRLIKLHKSQ